jgi:hypothetical protein
LEERELGVVARRELRGFRRLHGLLPGQAARVEFALAPEDFEVVDAEGRRAVEAGEWHFHIGTGDNAVAGRLRCCH